MAHNPSDFVHMFCPRCNAVVEVKNQGRSYRVLEWDSKDVPIRKVNGVVFNCYNASRTHSIFVGDDGQVVAL